MSHYTRGQEQDVARALQLVERIAVALESQIEVSKSINNALVAIAERLGYEEEYRPTPMITVDLPEEDTESPEYTEAVQKAAATFDHSANHSAWSPEPWELK